MGDQLILKDPDEQAGHDQYVYVLRVCDTQGYYLTAIDELQTNEEGTICFGFRNGVEVTVFSAALPFTMSLRRDFITKSRIELYEEQLEVQVEAHKFGENAKRILGITPQPSSGYQE